MTAVAPVMQGYFTDRLAALRASQNTIAAYRDTYRLLLKFTQQQTGKAPSALDLADLDASLILRFLDSLERDRHNSIASRNLRLAAIQSLFHYAALRCPEHAALIARVLAIPNKRPDQRRVTFLTREESIALLAAPDQSSPLGRRDHLLLAVAIHTGLRVSELTGLTWADVVLGTGAHVRCTGKGRKERCTPVTKDLAKQLAGWHQHDGREPADPVFHGPTGKALSNDAVADLVAKHLHVASRTCPRLTARTITPHTLRHTCAMNLLQAGVDIATIALWLGHANIRTTQVYLHADLSLKEKALALTAPPETHGRQRYKPSDTLLAFLEGL